MAGEANNQQIDVAAITKTVTEAVSKVVTEQFKSQLDELAANQKIISDTIANDKKPAGEKAGEKAGDKDDAATPLTAEAINKLVADGVTTALKARDESSSKAADRQKLIDKIKAEKLGGDDELAGLLAGDDEAALTASADKLAAKIKTFKPDFGGAPKDGGAVPGGEKVDTKAPMGNLAPGTQRFASSLKMPT